MYGIGRNPNSFLCIVLSFNKNTLSFHKSYLTLDHLNIDAKIDCWEQLLVWSLGVHFLCGTEDMSDDTCLGK